MTSGRRLRRRLLEDDPDIDYKEPIVNGFNLPAGPQADTQVVFSFTISNTI
jgi:hypothetical protein